MKVDTDDALTEVPLGPCVAVVRGEVDHANLLMPCACDRVVAIRINAIRINMVTKFFIVRNVI